MLTSFIHINQKPGTIQICVNWSIDKQTGTLLSYKKEQTADICHNMDEPKKHEVKEARRIRLHTI